MFNVKMQTKVRRNREKKIEANQQNLGSIRKTVQKEVQNRYNCLVIVVVDGDK